MQGLFALYTLERQRAHADAARARKRFQRGKGVGCNFVKLLTAVSKFRQPKRFALQELSALLFIFGQRFDGIAYPKHILELWVRQKSDAAAIVFHIPPASATVITFLKLLFAFRLAHKDFFKEVQYPFHKIFAPPVGQNFNQNIIKHTTVQLGHRQ